MRSVAAILALVLAASEPLFVAGALALIAVCLLLMHLILPRLK